MVSSRTMTTSESDFANGLAELRFRVAKFPNGVFDGAVHPAGGDDDLPFGQELDEHGRCQKCGEEKGCWGGEKCRVARELPQPWRIIAAKGAEPPFRFGSVR